MDEVKVISVILCTKERRGDGKVTPIRQITEIFSTAGGLLAECDIYSVNLEQIRKAYSNIPGDGSLTLSALLAQLGLPEPGQI